MRRLIGAGAGVLFKGGGFCQTDYRSESYKAGAKAESEAGKGDSQKESSGDKKNKADTTSTAKKKTTGGESSKTRQAYSAVPTFECPTCGKVLANLAHVEDAPYRPFCSERCQLIDLHHWFAGDFRISDPIGDTTDRDEVDDPDHPSSDP